MVQAHVHLYDARRNELLTMDGRVLRPPRKPPNSADGQILRILIRSWALSKGYVQENDEIGYLEL